MIFAAALAAISVMNIAVTLMKAVLAFATGVELAVPVILVMVAVAVVSVTELAVEAVAVVVMAIVLIWVVECLFLCLVNFTFWKFPLYFLV